jgi:multiple sugar transport system permease protein
LKRGWLSTSLAGLLIFAFLLPLAYMAVTSLKSEEMVANIGGPILPRSPATLEFEGKELDIYTVPLPDGTEMGLAMLKPGREVSEFIDPADPTAPPIEWEGNWRILEPAYELDPQWVN